MCGIYGITGSDRESGEKVFEGLKQLEYRGYDSWGVAQKTENDIDTQKEVGKISEGTFADKGVREAIGHSRWATHGGVTVLNAHPHTVGEVTIVHNGIFDNYLDNKEKLVDAGYGFRSETDSEIFAGLVDYYYQESNDSKQAIMKAVADSTGRYAVLVIFKNEPGLYGVRCGSPLIVGVDEHETHIGSDIPAFLEYTNSINYLDDGQMIVAHGAERAYYDLKTGKTIEKNNIVVNIDNQEVDKGDFDHYMIKEIFEQKETIERALLQDKTLIQNTCKLFDDFDRVFIVGCGTGHKVAMVGEYFFSELAELYITAVPASEMNTWYPFITSRTVVIAVSQSGETADVLEVVEEVKKRKGSVIAVTNAEQSSLAQQSGHMLPIKAGIEKAVASTKAATAQIAVLYLLAATIGEKGKRAVGNLLSLTANLNDQLNPNYADYVQNIAELLQHHRSLFIIGRGVLYPIALEAAIKIQEVSYIHAQGFAAGELKHGPIALIEKGTPCLVLGSDPQTLSSAEELKARGAMIIGIAPEEAKVFDRWLSVPKTERANAIGTLIPIQFLSYYLSTKKGLDPDMPRNLAKSVTVK